MGIRLIYTSSPQAKGRIERDFQTLQDRLINELRLNNITTIDEADHYLKKERTVYPETLYLIKEQNTRYLRILTEPVMQEQK